MTDLNLTILPVSKFTIRAGYSQNIMQGPTLSSIHEGSDGLLLQNWRNSTDDLTFGADWKPVAQTKVTYEERIVHYKGNTSFQMAPQALNLQLSNGTPVSLGYDNVAVPANSSGTSPCGSKPPILSGTTGPPTANSCVNGFIQYTRTQPTRTLFPTEEFRFQSASVPRLHMNGRVSYTGANTDLPNYFEYFNGLLSRTGLQVFTITGNAKAQRINVAASFGAVVDITKKLSVAEEFDHTDFRQSGVNNTSEVDQSGTNMLVAPGAPKAAVLASSRTALGQKIDTNTVTAAYELSDRISFSLGYRYRARTLHVTQAGDDPYSLTANENTGFFNVDLRPTSRWRVNGVLEAGYADNAYVQINPRQHYQYKVRASYKPKDWAVLSGAYNDIERHSNASLVNHMDHNRSLSFAASVNRSERYGFDLNYGYTDVYTQTTECYYSTVAGAPVPTGTACGSNTLLSNYYFDAPTQFGAASIMLAPVKSVRTNLGFRVTGNSGNTVYDNPRQVPGALRSQYMSPYANVAWTVHPGWIWRGDWNYYGYGEDGSAGPTLPRVFHSNVVTIGMHYEF
jgi:hypothetical protein